MNSITSAKALILGSAVAGAMTMAALGLAGTAAAAPGGGSNALDTITRLTDQGYSVQINHNGGWSDVPLSQCIVNGIHGLIAGVPPGQPLSADQSGTAYVDVGCSTTE
jgi:hypothetical protein